MTSLDQWVCRENIERFRALYAMATDERKRKTLLELLAQEQAELQELTSTPLPTDPAQDAQRERNPGVDLSLNSSTLETKEPQSRQIVVVFSFGRAETLRTPNSIEEETAKPKTDDETRMASETICSQRRDQFDSYELWQGTRLVSHQLGSSDDNGATTRISAIPDLKQKVKPMKDDAIVPSGSKRVGGKLWRPPGRRLRAMDFTPEIILAELHSSRHQCGR